MTYLLLESMKLRISNNGVIEALIEVLTHFPQNHRLIEFTCKALNNCIYGQCM